MTDQGRRLTTAQGNYAVKGAGIYNASGTATINNMTLQNNQADSAGGGFYVTGGNLTFNTCTIQINTAPVGNGGSWAPGAANSYSLNGCTSINQSYQVDQNP